MIAKSNHGSGGWRRGPSLAALALLALVSLLTVLASTRPAGAIGTGGPNGFGLAPAPDSQGQAPPYFSLNVAAGRSAASLAVVFNLGQHPQTLSLTRSLGVTATNSGTAYEPSGPCHGPACWVSGLPRQVKLAAGTREELRFAVRVPRGTKPGQYLAGLTVQPAARPKPVPLGSRHGANARAIIIRQVSVGVAVTVGRLSALHTAFRVNTVTGQAIGKTARLNLALANTGQTFAHAAGQVTCTAASKPRTYPIRTSTILPHQAAQIAVNAPGLPEGVTVPCTIRLRYARDQLTRWSGTVSLPAPPANRIVHTGPGAYSVVPTGTGLLPWLIGLLVVGILILAVLALLLYRHRQRTQ